MADNWDHYCCGAPDMECNECYIDVRFSDDRRQRVIVDEQNEAYLLSAFIIRQAAVASIRDLPFQVWLRNRATSLIGFRIDKRGRLVGEALVPKPGLTAEEFRIYVRTIATECDRLEYLLSGQDQE